MRGDSCSRFAVLLGVILCLERALAAPLGLSVSGDGTLEWSGRPFRGLGVNYYDAFVRVLSVPERPHPDAGFRELAQRGIPFLRFSAGGYWPVEWGLYRTNRTEYFSRLDRLVRSAEHHGLGLIPSLFWNVATVPDLVGDPVSAWGDPRSRTSDFMRTYTREVVTRYRDSPALWAWEFGNEYNLPADLPNAADHRPPVVPSLGTPGVRTAADELTHDQVRTALAGFAREVRRWDSRRAIFSGNAFPRSSAWHQWHEHTWAADSPVQWSSMVEGDNPAPMDTLTGRLYSAEDAGRVPGAMELSRRIGKPLFIGEFGVPAANDTNALIALEAQLDLLERAGVPIAALWVYDFDGQASDWNVTPDNGRRALLEAVAERNRRWRSASESLRKP